MGKQIQKRIKCSNTQKNRIVIHLDSLEKRIYKEELDDWISQGWKIGISEQHRQNISTSHIGQQAWNTGLTKEISTSMQKIADKLKGQPGHAPWNKGLTKENDKLNALIQKSKDTKIKRFGNAFGNNNMDQNHKDKISKALKGRTYEWPADKLQIKLSKDYLTKKKNNSFNKSKPEQELYETLLKENVNKTIYRQYKDNRYPFYCDFYIVEDDLFIELNAHWSHGGRPFDPTDDDCIKQLNIWKEKAKTSKFYENAIETWTVRDVKKRETALKNHLNYKVIY